MLEALAVSCVWGVLLALVFWSVAALRFELTLLGVRFSLVLVFWFVVWFESGCAWVFPFLSFFFFQIASLPAASLSSPDP